MRTLSKRAENIRKLFELRTIVDASQVIGYEALWFNADGSVFSRIEGSIKTEVCRAARCRWGHFNFQDEAEEFARIFPPQFHTP